MWDGSTVTDAFSSARLTWASVTPGSLARPFSLRFAQAAHVMPRIARDTFCSGCFFSATAVPTWLTFLSSGPGGGSGSPVPAASITLYPYMVSHPLQYTAEGTPVSTGQEKRRRRTGQGWDSPTPRPSADELPHHFGELGDGSLPVVVFDGPGDAPPH